MSGKRKQERGAQRARILESAGYLFSARGLDDVTMAEVASEAGVARATVFNHFGSKHALVEAITEDVLAYYQEMLENALANRETPVPVLILSLFELMGLGIEEDRRFYRSVFREIAKIRLGLDEGTPGQRAGRTAIERLVHLMTRGQARGEITCDHRPEDLASAFDSLVNGTITHWLYDDAAESLQLRMQRAAKVFLHAAADAATATATATAPRAPLAPPRDRTPRRSQKPRRAKRKKGAERA